MPILGRYAVAPPDNPGSAFAESRMLSFVSLDGQNILPLNGAAGFISNKMTGLDMPPLQIDHDGTPGMVGTKLRNITIQPREPFIPLFISSRQSHAHFLSLRDEIDALMDLYANDWASNDGTFDLQATSLKGTRYLRCLYSEGFEGDMTRGANGARYESAGMKLLCVNPLWRGDQWSVSPIRAHTSAKWFGRFPGRLSSSRTLGGDVAVGIPGTEPSWPVAEIVGPCVSAAINGPGFSVTIPAGLDDGEKCVIRTNPRNRDCTFDGVRDWSRIAPTLQFAPMWPGQQWVNFGLETPTVNTTAQVYGDSWYRRPW